MLVRTVTDAVTATSTALTSATAAFVADDVGGPVSGSGIPAGTRIASVTNATTVVLSAATTATASGVTVAVGAGYQTAAQLRTAVTTLANETSFPTALLADYVYEFEKIAEKYLGVAFLQRTETETIQIEATRPTLMLRWPKIIAVSSVAIDGTAVTVADLTLDKPAGRIIYPDGSFSAGTEVVVTYTHGYDAPLPQLIRACRQYVRSVALADQSGVSREAISTTVEGVNTRYSTPDWTAGRPTGYLEVDRLLNACPRYRTVMA